jgi:hypothetical protein
VPDGVSPEGEPLARRNDPEVHNTLQLTVRVVVNSEKVTQIRRLWSWKCEMYW